MEEKSLVEQTHEKVVKIEKALLGDRLERKIGYLEQVEENTKQIMLNAEGIKKNKDAISKNSKINFIKGLAAGAAAGGSGVGFGSKIITFFKALYL